MGIQVECKRHSAYTFFINEIWTTDIGKYIIYYVIKLVDANVKPK